VPLAERGESGLEEEQGEAEREGDKDTGDVGDEKAVKDIEEAEFGVVTPLHDTDDDEDDVGDVERKNKISVES